MLTSKREPRCAAILRDRRGRKFDNGQAMNLQRGGFLAAIGRGTGPPRQREAEEMAMALAASQVHHRGPAHG